MATTFKLNIIRDVVVQNNYGPRECLGNKFQALREM